MMTNLEEYKQIEVAITNLHSKLQKLEIKHLQISDYNKVYLKKYILNYPFYMSLYHQLLLKALKKLKKPITESVFIDYGGGCGILSYLAKEVGFKSVIYNDIYDVSINDTQIIAAALSTEIDYYIHGDINQFVNEVNSKNINPDLICSFDVLEHIYNLENWFETIDKIDTNFSLLFMTSANSKNLYISKKLKKLQIKAEYQSFKKTIGWKKTDLNTSFLEARKNIIKNKFPQLRGDEITKLSIRTRGLRKDDIEKEVENYIKTNEIEYQINHSTNTCDPYTGNWMENLIDLEQLKTFIKKNNLKVEITNSFYAYSNNKIFNIPKYTLNFIIKLLGSKSLFLSPTYTLEVQKINSTT